MDRLIDDWRPPTHSLALLPWGIYIPFKTLHPAMGLPHQFWNVPEMPVPRQKYKCSSCFSLSKQHTASPSFNFLTASSLNCCSSCTFMVVGVDDDDVFTARKPNIPFPWLCCKQPFSIWQQQTRKIKTRVPKALTKSIPLAKVNVIQHHSGKASRRGKQLLPGCVCSVWTNKLNSLLHRAKWSLTLSRQRLGMSERSSKNLCLFETQKYFTFSWFLLGERWGIHGRTLAFNNLAGKPLSA